LTMLQVGQAVVSSSLQAQEQNARLASAISRPSAARSSTSSVVSRCIVNCARRCDLTICTAWSTVLMGWLDIWTITGSSNAMSCGIDSLRGYAASKFSKECTKPASCLSLMTCSVAMIANCRSASSRKVVGCGAFSLAPIAATMSARQRRNFCRSAFSRNTDIKVPAGCLPISGILSAFS
jgi:hypothetical protein